VVPEFEFDCDDPPAGVIQQFVDNPFLINGSVAKIRTFLVVVSMDPILIFYADGWVVIAQENYDPKSTDAEYLTTNPSKDTWSFDNL